MSAFLKLCAAVFVTSFVVILVSNIFSVQFFSKKKKKEVSRKTIARANWLAQAGMKMTPQQFTLMTASSVLFSFLIISLFSKAPLVAIVPSAAAGAIPYMSIAKKRNSRLRELSLAWPDALRDLTATISAGHPLSFALSTLATTGPDVLKPYMSRFSTLERTMGFTAALETVREEMSDATTDRIVEVLIVANDRGGKVVREILDDLIEATSEDIALADSIQSESLEMKINSRAVVVLPWCVLILLTLSGGVFRSFYSSKAGALVILAGALLSALGIYVLSRFSRVDVEPRVFLPAREIK